MLTVFLLLSWLLTPTLLYLLNAQKYDSYKKLSKRRVLSKGHPCQSYISSFLYSNPWAEEAKVFRWNNEYANSLFRAHTSDGNNISKKKSDAPIHTYKVLKKTESTIHLILELKRKNLENHFMEATRNFQNGPACYYKESLNPKIRSIPNLLKIKLLESIIQQAVNNIEKELELKFIGKLRLLKPIENILLYPSPQSIVQIDLEVDILPKVNFKKPYLGIQLKVPKPPYPHNLLWNLTLDELSSRYAIEENEIEERGANWGDSVIAEITRIYQSHTQPTRNKSLKYPGLNLGNTSIIMERYWNPPGLCEGLLEIKKNQKRTINIELPLSEDFNVSYKSEDKLCDHTFFPHSFNVTLDIVCIMVRNRKKPTLDDTFFINLCNRTKGQMKSEIEAHAEKEIEKRCQRARRGAVEQFLGANVIVDIPEAAIYERCLEQYKEYTERKRIAYEDDGTDANLLSFEDWKEKSLEGVVKGLKLEFAIKYIKEKEKIEIDDSLVFQALLELKLKIPFDVSSALVPKIRRLKEAESVYDWIADQANISYYVDHRPVQITVDNSILDHENSTLVTFKPGASRDLYEKQKDEMRQELDKILHFKTLSE